ncbi:unnamed protein product [Spirodela intermedia]|uniref:Uncharacterized protein n=1 Tax=Spirodela intermedia TaxID=51605 RepID=A0A7I8JHP8_SPIIN|nr:unnamed protein product [Spirodela intermedia]CAA6669275.1 unnamed protein product [Spirodela intermedia]
MKMKKERLLTNLSATNHMIEKRDLFCRFGNSRIGRVKFGDGSNINIYRLHLFKNLKRFARVVLLENSKKSIFPPHQISKPRSFVSLFMEIFVAHYSNPWRE